MNRIDFNQTGGHPLTLDDFEFIQDAWTSAFRAVAAILQNPTASSLDASFHIFGCERTNPSAGLWAFAQGFVVIEGEFYYVPAHTVAYLSVDDPLFWTIEQTSVLPSPLQYKDFSIKSVHLQRVAKVTTVPSAVPYLSLKSIRAALDARMRGRSGTLPLLNGWTGTLEFNVVAGRIQLYGFVQASSNAINSAPICQIPAELTPKVVGYGYSGSMPPLTSDQAIVLGLAVALSGGGLSFNATRLYLNGTAIWSTVQWPIMIELLNLTSAPPRIANLRVMQPQNIPSGSNSVTYNLNGISWDIAPE